MINAIRTPVIDIDAGIGLNARFHNPPPRTYLVDNGLDLYIPVVRTPEEGEMARQTARQANRPIVNPVVMNSCEFLKTIPDDTVECFLVTDAFSKMTHEEMVDAIKNMHRALRKGGVMYFTDEVLHP